jgi:hypothetical protein
MIYKFVEGLKKLEVMKLIKELDFLESEFKYKSEFLKEIDFEFKRQVESILEMNQDLEKQFSKSIEFFFERKEEVLNDINTEELEEIEIFIEKNPKVKSLYRIIAKSTHPDKKNDDNLKEIYMEATKAYENNELLPIISICDKLKIPYEISEEEFDNLKKEISILKRKSNFLESTYSWQWYVKPNIEEKTEIVLRFIRAQIF